MPRLVGHTVASALAPGCRLCVGLECRLCVLAVYIVASGLAPRCGLCIRAGVQVLGLGWTDTQQPWVWPLGAGFLSGTGQTPSGCESAAADPSWAAQFIRDLPQVHREGDPRDFPTRGQIPSVLVSLGSHKQLPTGWLKRL